MNAITQRVRISTGLDCNIRCPFCYYGEELGSQRYSGDNIKKMLDAAWKLGVRDIDFSGGEPTIRKDFPEFIAYAKEIGFRQICVITNGVQIAKKDYLQKLIDVGLNEVLLSVHGGDEDSADTLAGLNGMFPIVQKALDNIAASGIRLRTNTVINRENMHLLPEICDLITKYRPAAANFICFNDWVNAAPATKDMAIRFSEAAEVLMPVIDKLKLFVGKVTVRYMPFCLLPGHEEHICGLLQNTYDTDEWLDSNKRVVTDMDSPERHEAYKQSLTKMVKAFPDGLLTGLGAKEIAALDGVKGLENPFSEITIENTLAAHTLDNYTLRLEYVKADGCQECAAEKICDGLHSSYATILGTDELKPIKGPKITDPMHFRRRKEKDIAS